MKFWGSSLCGNLLKRFVTIKQRSRLLKRLILCLDDEEVEEDDLDGQPDDVNNL